MLNLKVITNQESLKIDILICLVLFTGFLLASCKPSEPFSATITELSTCQGLDTLGNPIKISPIFASNVDRISVCAHLETNIPPITLSVNWYHNDRLIHRHTLRTGNGYFDSALEATDGTFQTGVYIAETVIGKRPVQTIEIRVE